MLSKHLLQRGDRYFLVHRKWVRLSICFRHVGFGVAWNFNDPVFMLLIGVFYLTVGAHDNFTTYNGRGGA